MPDRSGSMAGLEKDTIGGINSLIRKRREEEGEDLNSTVLFDNCSEVIRGRVPPDRIPELTGEGALCSGLHGLAGRRGRRCPPYW